MKFKDLKIKTKLIILSAIPMFVIFVLSSIAVYQNFNKKVEYAKLEKVIELNAKVSLLIHETQKERGATAGFLGSKGTKFVDKLPAQRLNTDKKIADFKKFLTQFDKSSLKDTSATFNNALSDLEQITTIRSQVSSLSIGTKQAIAYYTNMNALFLNFIAQTSKLSTDSDMTYNILSYYNFLMSKERAGIERAVGSATFANDKFAVGAKSKLESLVAEQNSYMDSFISLSTKEAIDFKNKTLQGKDIDEVNRMRKVLFDANEVGGFGIDGTYWFDTITKKINHLKDVENYISTNIKSNDQYINDAMKVSIAIANLLHETQKERGATAGFLGSKGKKFTKRLPNQRENTNVKLAKLRSILASFNLNSYNKDIKKNINAALKLLDNLNNIRTQVSALNIKASKAIGYYTKMNGSFLDAISSSISIINNPKELVNFTAYYNFLMAKERAGIERAVLSNTFSRNKFLPGMKEKFTKLVTEQSSFTQSFLAVANDDFKSYYYNKMKNKSIAEVQRMRDIAKNAKTIGGFGIDSGYWFDTITKKINLLKQIDDYLSKKLTEKSTKLFICKSGFLYLYNYKWFDFSYLVIFILSNFYKYT
jgi:methyl-accepting chemotaxis protein